MFFQHFFNTLLLWSHYCLLSFGFYFASISCRHINFSAGLAYIIGSYFFLLLLKYLYWPFSLVLALITCSAIGAIYYQLSIWLHSKGAREGQQLFISLGIMAIGENCIILAGGSGSWTLWPFTQNDLIISLTSLHITRQECVVIGVNIGVILIFLWCWQCSVWGVIIRGLAESRLNLSLRGYNLVAIENWVAVVGFFSLGLSGMLWGVSSRVRSSSAMETSIIGVVTFIVGPLIRNIPWGLVFAALAIVSIKLLMTLLFEGDWGMTAPLIIFFISLIFLRNKMIFRMWG